MLSDTTATMAVPRQTLQERDVVVGRRPLSVREVVAVARRGARSVLAP
jgi:hypothetical protein